MTLSFTTRSATETRALGARLGALLEPGDVVVLAGGLGSGKTTFVQGAITALGVSEPVISPTFALIKTYDGRLSVAHVDVYRLDYLQELYDLGFEEVLDDGRAVLIEWGDRITPALPEERLTVHLELTDDAGHRTIRFVPLGRRWPRRVDALAAQPSDAAES